MSKVRWTFDILRNEPNNNFDYCEDAHVPGLAAVYTTELCSQTSATPIIKNLHDGKIMKDSTAIMRSYAPGLYIADDDDTNEDKNVIAYEEYLDETLGPCARVFAYHQLLGEESKPMLISLATQQTSWIETFLFTQLVQRNFIQPGMRKFMGISEESSDLSREEIFKVFTKVEEDLKKNDTGYLVGSRFTAADLTFAALSSPILRLQQFDSLMPSPVNFPPFLESTIDELRATVAGKHAIKCYDEYRFGSYDSQTLRISKIKGGYGTAGTLLRQVAIRSGSRNNAMAMGLTVVTMVGVPVLAGMAALTHL